MEEGHLASQIQNTVACSARTSFFRYGIIFFFKIPKGPIVTYIIVIVPYLRLMYLI